MIYLGFLGQYCEIECGVTFFDQNQKIVGGFFYIFNNILFQPNKIWFKNELIKVSMQQQIAGQRKSISQLVLMVGVVYVEEH